VPPTNGILTNGILFGYTGKQLDEATGLQHNLNRWYDARLGQWISEDPIGFAAGDENVRRYVGNRVTRSTDPDGLQTRDEAEAEAAAAAQASAAYAQWNNDHWTDRLWNFTPIDDWADTYMRWQASGRENEQQRQMAELALRNLDWEAYRRAHQLGQAAEGAIRGLAEANYEYQQSVAGMASGGIGSHADDAFERRYAGEMAEQLEEMQDAAEAAQEAAEHARTWYEWWHGNNAH